MALWTTRRAGALAILAAGLGLIGCGGNPAKPDSPKAVEVQPDVTKTEAKSEKATAEPVAEQHAKTAPLDYIEAGCPLDKGDPEDGSIGYWLRAEGGPGLTHEVGSVGASHGRERDSAACKFYITLCNAPYLDRDYTVFGKVTRGLDV